MASSGRPLRSGELARATGVSSDTLRHYERLSLLSKPPRSASGYRAYPPEALDRVRLIRNALAAGFHLGELAKILRVRDRGGAPCHQVLELGRQKLLELDGQITQLERLRQSLRMTLKEWEMRLQEVPHGSRAGLLESLTSPEKLTRPAISRRRPL
jgi:DNA-binding transcriptional MerR regulator